MDYKYFLSWKQYYLFLFANMKKYYTDIVMLTNYFIIRVAFLIESS